ncbi:MAG: hypothetical protein PHU63_04690, partial [Candidatus ainarchaeum sp.]|nr:hypothetical protein [Candidatus ainarchaeum sp.]
MVERKITVKVYVLALFITIAIFLLGVFVGQIVNTEVSKQLLDEVKYYSMDSDSLNIMLLLDPSP